MFHAVKFDNKSEFINNESIYAMMSISEGHVSAWGMQ